MEFKENGELQQCYEDLPEALEDCKKFREGMEQYGITDPKNEYWLGDNPSEAEVLYVFRKIGKKLKEGKER